MIKIISLPNIAHLSHYCRYEPTTKDNILEWRKVFVGARALGRRPWHTFCKHLKTRFKQKSGPKYA